MRLQEIFDQLSSGEFSKLSIGGQEAGVINESNWGKVLGHVNLGLTALFTRFTIKEGRITLAVQPDLLRYKLNSAFAVNGRGSQEPVRYILDTVDEKFTDDILKVTQVLTDKDIPLALNDGADTYSVMTPSALVLQVPKLLAVKTPHTPDFLKTETLQVVYRANHNRIAPGFGYFDPARVEVGLPNSHLLALLYFVASRVHNPVGMVNEFNAGNNYAMKYEQACMELEGKGMQVDQGSSNTRFERNGWC